LVYGFWLEDKKAVSVQLSAKRKKSSRGARARGYWWPRAALMALRIHHPEWILGTNSLVSLRIAKDPDSALGFLGMTLFTGHLSPDLT
jgi:hypothetical protein